MQQLNAFPVFALGGALTMLVDRLATKGYTFNDLARDSANTIESLVYWIRSPISAPLSKEVAVPIVQALDAARSSDYLKAHGVEEIKDDVKNDLNYQLHNFTSLFRAELSNCDVYLISQKRGHNMPILIFAAERHLDKIIAENLCPECIEEIREGGRCLAFDLPTASGFHINRALELALLMYFPVLKIEIPPEKKRSWGSYIQLLEGKDLNGKEMDGAEKADERITYMLRHIKDFYRNPLMHPAWVLTDNEAQNLFNLAISAISAMVTDILSRKPESATDGEVKKES
jgi:hypothetical protein